MILEDLYILLKETGYPVAYSHFNANEDNPPPMPPFITYLVTNSENFGADNKVYKKIYNIQIELYTLQKDIEAEELLENILDKNEIYYEISESFIESESLFQRIYEVRLM